MRDKDIFIGDIIKFKYGDGILFGRVNAKGRRFRKEGFSVLYVSVFDHSRGNITIEAGQVIEVIIIPEVVHFT